MATIGTVALLAALQGNAGSRRREVSVVTPTPLTVREEHAVWLAYYLGGLPPTSPAAQMLLRLGLVEIDHRGLASLTTRFAGEDY